jgi:hypothetical protein
LDDIIARIPKKSGREASTTGFDGFRKIDMLYCRQKEKLTIGSSVLPWRSTIFPPLTKKEDTHAKNRGNTLHRSPAAATERKMSTLRRFGIRSQLLLYPLRKEAQMTLAELSKDYAYAAGLLRARLRLLRNKLAQSEDPEERFWIQRRILALTPMLTEMNELAELTAHYYDRGYYRNDKYTL